MSIFDAIAPEVHRLEAYLEGIKGIFANKVALETENQQLKAELSLAQGALAAAEADEADLTAKLKAANDALAAMQPHPAA